MKFFKLLPKINYEEYKIRNLFYKFYFLIDIPNKYLYQYIIKDNENLESISFDIYNDSAYWWLLAIINDIRDIIFDLPLDVITLQKIATSESSPEGVLDLNLFSIAYDILEIENDLKRNIKILKPEFLNTVIGNIIKEV